MRLVICCDYGAPNELVRDALRIGTALAERGHAVAHVVGEPIALVEAAGGRTPPELYQAPVHRAGPNLVMKRPVVDGFADVMATAGFDDKSTLFALASMWDSQLKTLQPDAIIGFYTPTLWLVGPAHAPTFAVGSGFMLPPVAGTSFPRLLFNSSPIADDDLMLSNANATLLRQGQPALASLSEVVGRAASILYGVPAFDPYLQIRRTVTTGLLGEEPSPTVVPAKPRVAALLDAHCPGIESIVLALAAHESPVDVCINAATTSMRRFLEQQPHVTVWKDYLTLLEQAASATIMVHHGVQDVAQRCVSLGRPQLLFPWTPEQKMFEGSTRWMGLFWKTEPGASIQTIADTLRSILNDAAVVVAAQHYARQLANTNLPNALPIIIKRVEAAGAVSGST